MSARFDDLAPGKEHSFALENPVRHIAAFSLDEVGPALDEVAAATRDGLWAAGFITYEAAAAFDPALRVRPPDESLPIAWFGLYRTRTDLDPPLHEESTPGYSVSAWLPEVSATEHATAISRIRHDIEHGITYQVNHTFRMRSVITGDIEAFYHDLVLAQRGGYGAWIDTGRFVVASASPEMFFSLDGREIRMRPMKGTTDRGRWPAEDAEHAAALIASDKDRAENLMIVDLLRNDLGRVAEFGSVRVPTMFDLERYETVWQLTSSLEATLRPDVGLRDLFGAVFPSGSVTGAPKASTMDLIAELEASPRGVYCGAIGYVAPRGDARFNVAIRTVVIDRETGAAEYGTGGGITWDSTPEAEFDEAVLKTKVLTYRDPPFSLIETMRLEDGEYLFEERHLQRLAASAAYFGFRYSEADVASALRRHTTSPGAAMVRLTLERFGAVRLETVEAPLAPFADGPEASPAPIALAVTATPIDSHDRMHYHKTTARRAYEEARRAAGGGEALLVNEVGEITEATVANVVVRHGSQWVTPPIESGCLPGVYRGVLLESGIIVEGVIRVEDLEQADGIALINSVRGWRAAVLA